MVDEDLRLTFVPITLGRNVENAIHILVLHLEDVLPLKKFAERNIVFLLQTFENLLMLVRRPNMEKNQKSCRGDKDCQNEEKGNQR